MLLLDRVLEVGAGHIVTELTVRDDGLFSSSNGTVPAWVGMEYMAQAIAAVSGYQRRLQGQTIELGFLLGTRYYQCYVGHFRCGAVLQVRAEKIMDAANDMSVFDCKIEGDGLAANSMINVFLPRDSKQFIAGIVE